MRRYVCIVIAAALLGLLGTLVKLTEGTIPPMTLSFFRLLTGAIFLVIVLPFIDRKTFRVTRQDLKNYIVLGLIIAVDFTLYIYAFYLVPVSNVVLLTFTFPFWLAIISYFLLNERVSRYMLLCLVLAFAGISIINPFQGGLFMGNMVSLANAVLYAFMYAYMRYIDKRHTIGVVFWFILFGAIFLSPAPFIYGLGTVSWNYLWVILAGIFSTGLAYLFLNFGLEKLQAETTSLIVMTTEPVVAIGLSILIIGEILSLEVLIGGILIIAAGMILEKKHAITKR